jgi:hypothetical protein
MKKIKIIAGVSWAFAGLVLIIILFPGLNSLSSSASRLPFMKINPNYSGGEVSSRFLSDGCTLVVRKPVFNWLIGEKKNGFVQVDWIGDVAGIIEDSIDYDLDGISDFIVEVDRNRMKTQLMPLNPRVQKMEISTQTSYGWTVRVGIKK